MTPRTALHNETEKPHVARFAARGMLNEGVKTMAKTNADIENWDVESEEF